MAMKIVSELFEMQTNDHEHETHFGRIHPIDRKLDDFCVVLL